VPNDLRLDARPWLPHRHRAEHEREVDVHAGGADPTARAGGGSFVPARTATVGLVDGIYTRVGALDELAQGRSTFMVEMQELSNILHSATADSLVILDEVGRGTATYDGISIAWAATEYLHNEVRARTLFATHYHELTTLADHLPRVANVHVAVDERDGEVTFLRTVRDGPTNRSYGVHVADLGAFRLRSSPAPGRCSTGSARRRRSRRRAERGGAEGRTRRLHRHPDGDTKQVVFDLSSGSFSDSDDAGSTEATAPGAEEGRNGTPPGSGADGVSGTTQTAEAAEAVETDRLDPETRAVIEELTDVDVAETAPVELLSRVQEWQERLGENR